MKRQLLFIVSTISILFLVGCSTNEVKIVNEADFAITLTFRGEEHTVNATNTKTIDGIPDGTFEYGTTGHVPKNSFTNFEMSSDCNGKLTFVEHNTDYVLFYGSFTESSVSKDSTGTTDSTVTYNLNCNISSSVPDEALKGD